MAAKAALEKSAESERPPLVVGVGASAGGLEAFQELLTAIGDAPGMAIVFVQHLDPHSKSLLAELLTKTTAMPIVELTGREKLKSGTVYLCPPQRLLETKNGFVSIVENDHETRLHNVIDYFLHSIAQDLGERGVGVILSGGGSDGTLGLKAISDAEGLTFAQEPTSAKFDSMPRNAATTGVADHVLTPAEIAKELLQYSAHLNDIRSPKTRDHLQNQIVEAIPAIAEQLTSVTSHNFKHYKTSTLSRRILRRMQVLKMSNVSEYVRFLQGSDEETQTLFRELLIGVTAFFRDPEAFESLAENVLPKLFENRSAEDVVRIWVAGCATGAEAYTMAILCREALDRCDKLAPCGYVQIFATDIDERALQTARVGAYPVGIEDHISVERLKRFFTKRGKRYHVTKELRDMVLFSAHNLISDPPFSRLDLISCRNLLIYLGPHLQKKLIPVFHYALRPSGYLFLGPSENISSHAELFRTLDAKFRISQRKGTAVGSTNTISLLPSAIEASRTDSARSPDETADLTEVRQRILLDEFAPKSCIIDESGQVLNSSSNMQKYLSLSDGDFQNNVIKMAASGLRIGLRAAIAEARKSRRRVQHENLSIRLGDQIQRVMLTVQPMPRLGEDDSLFMVVFHDVGLPVNRDAIDDTVSGSTTDADSIIAQLERELETTREDLDKSLQDMEAANEELRSSNEELLSINEELQSANEELETSKEEIRSGSDAVARAHSDLENLLRSSQIATVFLDDELLIRSFTPAISEIYGLIATDIGRPLERFVPHVNDMPPLPNPQQIQDGSPIEHTVTADSGKTFIRRVLPYESHTGVYEGIVVTFLDVTDLQQSKNQLAQREAQLKTITDAIPPLIAFVDQDYRFRFVNAAYAKQWQRPIEQLVNQKVIDVVGADNYRGIEPHLRKSLAGETEKYDFSLQLPSGEVLHKEVTYVPDRDANGSVSGVHVVVNDVTERKQAERDLATAKTRLDLSLQISEVAPWNWDTERETVFTNPMLNRLFGFEPDAQPLLADFMERIDDATRDHVSAAIQRSIQTGDAYDEEYSVHWPNGEIRHLRARGQAQLSEDGTLEDFFGVVLDITERKRRELETADREAHLRRVIDNQLGMVGVLNIDGTLVEANATAIQAAGLKRDDVIGRKFWECYWWNYSNDVANQLRSAIQSAATGEIVRYDVTVRMAGDTRMLIDFMICPVRDSNGTITHLIPSGVDISERKKAEQKVAEREQRLQLALDSGGMGLWEWDIVADQIMWSDQMFEMFGYSRDTFDSTKSGFLNIVHQDDRPMLERMIQSAFTGTCRTHEVEFRIIRGDDQSVVWTLSRGTVHRDIDGRPNAIISVATDVTRRKQWEADLVDREAHLRRVINNQLGLVGVIGRDGRLLEVDDASMRIAGLTRDDVIGKHFAECAWWTYDETVQQQMHQAMERAFAGEVVRYDVPLYAAGLDGPDARLMIDFMMAPVFDDNGDVEYLIPSGVDISDRLKAENEIRENEQRLKMALKAGGMAAWEWTPEGSVWTDELYTLLGIPSDETPSPETFFRYVHPDDLDGIKQAWTGVTAQGALYDHEFRIIRPDGETRWLVGMGQVVRDPAGSVQRVFGLNCDITGQKEVQEQILTSEQRFREMANAAPAMVWVTDENHECTFLSQSWCDLTGQTETEGLGIGWLKVVHPDDREATKITFLSAAEQRESFELDFRLQTADGRYRWVINAGKPRFNDTKDFLGYVGSVTDAHERHEALLALNEARQAAEAANESKSAFLANMSHEIRTPMTAILGYADLVASLIDHSEATAHLQTIRRNGAFLLDIINDILDLSKIEADKLDIIQERFDPTRLVEDVRSIMEVRAKEGGIELSVEYHGEIPMEIESDSKRLKQILINLVGNAIKFTKQGGVKVVVTCCRPLSSTSEDSHVPETNVDTLRFDIIDSGIGMNRKQQKKLFQPFSQGDHSVNREFGGTGLGLAISQRLASMLGGTITVTSEEGKGSTFSFSIAIGNIGNVVMIRPQMTAEPGTGGAPSEDIRLSCHALIVDDRRDIRFLSRKFLTDAGATVSEAEDGEVAVTVVREAMTSGTPPDIIILDMQMPKLDGYETAKALRRMDYPGPIIALTADAMQGDMSRCIECGCNDYLSKPIDKDEMLKKVKQFVTR